MNIAIDLSPLQGPHRMRGIGYTIIHFVNSLPKINRVNDHYIFYVLESGGEQLSFDPFKLLNLGGLSYEVRKLEPVKRFKFKLPGKLKYLRSALNQILDLKDLRLGDPRVGSMRGVDIFVQCDQSQPLPRRRLSKKNVLFVYDIIPYVLEWDYLWNYDTAKRRGYSWKGASLCVVRRWLYKYKIKVNTARAHRLIAISSSTKKDFCKYLKIKDKKISVVPLGVPEIELHDDRPDLRAYKKTSWGYLPRPLNMSESEHFLLFVGGADRRRKLVDLVAAFNMLRAQGVSIKLVLAGDSMQGPDTVSTPETQAAIANSSYLEDIIFMGFVDDSSREWLYRNALAFVFPSRYEGFGLPVLEAMQYGTPVISYRNDATLEVASNKPIYVDSAVDMYSEVKRLLQSKSLSDSDREALIRQSEKYDWVSTTRAMVDTLHNTYTRA